MFKAIITILSFFVCFSIAAQVKQEKASGAGFPDAAAYKDKSLTYKITNVAGNTFCYDIYADNKLMIRQLSVPGMSGNEGFKTKAAAEKVALLVIGKIKKGEMPPSVTPEELKKLNAER